MASRLKKISDIKKINLYINMYACNGAEQPAGANPPPVRRAAAAHAYAYPAPGVFINPRYVYIYKSARLAASPLPGGAPCSGRARWGPGAARVRDPALRTRDRPTSGIPAQARRSICPGRHVRFWKKTPCDTCSPLRSSSLPKV